MKTWKKNAVAAAVLVTVCAGIYLNWMYTEDYTDVSLTDTLDGDKLLDESMLVMNSEESELAAQEMTGKDTASDYFAAVRLSRQEARDSAIALLQEAMSYDTSSQESGSDQLEDIVQVALSEAQIESLVIAKGYADCVAYMSEEGISVAVAAPENGLAQADVALITDIVMSQSAYELEDIRIVEVQ
jgi:stage III sporulation protein AH